MEAETSRFNLINVNATYFSSTSTVCGHAEACPSTTYTKQPPYLLPIAVAARWSGSFSPLILPAREMGPEAGP